MPTDEFTQLPLLAKPTHYSIRLKPDVEKFICEGTVAINVVILEETDFLVLHSYEIRVESAVAKLADGSKALLDVELDPKWQKLTLRFLTKVGPQTARLTLKFESMLNDKLRGFYRSTYKDVAGNTKYLFSTQFESTHARKSFPCWDEPNYKARFDVTLEVPERMTALSNMNVLSETASGTGTKVVKYATTPPMSTYLVAFAVGELEYIETETKDGVPVRVYTALGKKESGAFALDVAKKALEYHADWFGVPYPLPKCDLIAIPDFASGAMENWGLVTYREIALLVDSTQSTTLTKTRIRLIIGHEVAHFWFGNLVTMKWWQDLWLKEGFASYFAYAFLAATYPELNIWQHFVRKEIGGGFELDSLRSSHPIEVEIHNPNQLAEIFDAVMYAKSNSVIRMLCHYLSEATFQQGVRIYLQRFQYSNADTADLWRAFTDASAQDIHELMSSWTRQTGYPLISVEQTVDDDKRVYKLKQERFIADGAEDDVDSVWQVPVVVSTACNPSEPAQKFLMTAREQEFVIKGGNPNDFATFNAGAIGFYRVQYSDGMFDALTPAMQSLQMPVLDRFCVSNDLFALVVSGRASAIRFLEFLVASANEDAFIVWGAIDQGLGTIANVLNHHEDPTLRKRFDAFVCKALQPVFERLGWQAAEGEDPHTGNLRALILGRMSQCGHQPTIKRAVHKFYEHIARNTPLEADLRDMIFSTVGRTEGRKGADALKKIFESCKHSEVQHNCLSALGQTNDLDALKDAFNYAVHEGKVRPQDIIMLFQGASISKEGQVFAWNFVKANFETLTELFGGVNSRIFQRCVRLSVGNMASSLVAEEVEKFFKANLDAGNFSSLDRPVRQMTESIRLNEMLLTFNVMPLAKFFEQELF
ncbi:puromycin-sensitive aminopeptidase isoform 2 [Aphelenchoides avenae]|nr:puromycin-sensitive aminopeptidase isoform 2 [Aphelenchus avenae]